MTGVGEGAARALTRRLAVEQARARIPSVVAAVVRDGATVWSGARGFVDGAEPTPATQYRIGSITKSLVAVVVMRLRDEGLLDLLDPIAKHLPGLPAAGEVTVGQLLSHSGGLTAEPPTEWWERTPGVAPEALLAGLGDDTVRHRPGRRFHYSNLGFGLLGELVARHRGMPWERALHAELLAPLGMSDTTTRPRPPHATGYAVHPWADVLLPEPEHDAAAMAPAGQMWSTSADLAKFAAFLAGDTGGVLARATLAEMREPIVVEDGDAWTSGYGLGLQLARVRGRRLAGHTGSMPGFLATVWVDSSDATGVLFLANTTAGVGRSLPTDMLAVMDEHEPRLPEPWRPVPADPDLLALTGPWYWGPTAYVMRVLPDRALSLTPIGGVGRASRFVPDGPDTWLGLDGYYAGETLRVVKGGDGVTHLDVNTFVFTRRPYDPGAPVPGGVDPDGWR
ncbi:CubicO group peptidase, beta-lactamase class C family [Sinosporangium album]|uniref:CubicO group peptidase, beta-lactamase class C family n=1 Tax=Sinosporangium album TaxID=504805 RepID=A0A1G8DEX6_9ACTN|nr:serine hydrolase domain-containing protein [Sinosporangium album]SDH56252.1 CubicO group peptidase, beta-lactamase class C family [Sinosporangium album]